MASATIESAVVLTWALTLQVAGPGPVRADPPTVELQLAVRALLDEADLQLAETTTIQLVATAGIHVVWRHRADPSDIVGAPRVTAIVQLLPQFKMTDRLVSGETVRDQRTGALTVLVYVPRLVELTVAIRNTPDGRSHPALASVDLGHLVGLTVAHEIGHGLGLPHASSGLMKAKPSLPEILSLRSATLLFQDTEAARMRLALLASPEGQLARTR